jgi:hypothetical protein
MMIYEFGNYNSNEGCRIIKPIKWKDGHKKLHHPHCGLYVLARSQGGSPG